MAFTLLTGMRDDAIASLSIGHVNLDQRMVFQDAREVRTKNRKTMYTWFFPVGAYFDAIVVDWIGILTNELLFGLNDPVFPATKMTLDANRLFAPAGLDRRHWKNADPIRHAFQRAFEAVQLPAYNPHSFRKTLAILGEKVCKTPEEFKAWSQNLGHEHVLTTFTSYGEVPSHRQAEIFEQLVEPAVHLLQPATYPIPKRSRECWIT